MKRPRILVVDDEPGIRQSLVGVLEDEGYCAAAVESGEACLEELALQSYGLVLLDVRLPGIGGIETLERIQEIPLAERPVAVIISGASCSALAWAPLRKHQERTAFSDRVRSLQ